MPVELLKDKLGHQHPFLVYTRRFYPAPLITRMGLLVLISNDRLLIRDVVRSSVVALVYNTPVGANLLQMGS